MLWKRDTFSIIAPLGNLKGVRFLGQLGSEKEGSGNGLSLSNVIWIYFWTEII